VFSMSIIHIVINNWWGGMFSIGSPII